MCVTALPLRCRDQRSKHRHALVITLESDCTAFHVMTILPETSDYDSPWKEALERYFPQFLEFFFPQIHAEIDWSRGWTFLDKELQQVVRDADLGRRLVDKLVKVWKLDGTETAILIHIEVQGQRESDFAERMFV